MRLLDIIPEILLERNIVNANELKEKITSIAGQVNDPHNQTWFRSQLFKYIMNEYSNKSKGFSTISKPSRLDPAWAQREFKAGNKLYKVSIEGKLEKIIFLVINWLNNSNESKKGINMSWPEAVQRAKKWKSKENTNKTLESGAKKIITYSDGHAWYRLTNKTCIRDEGERLRNCLRYDYYTTGTGYVIYSLRDKAGKSKILLIEDRTLTPSEVEDIRGNKNSKPNQMYYPYIADIIYKKKMVLSNYFPLSFIKRISKIGFIFILRKIGGYIKRYSLFKLKDLKYEQILNTTNGNQWILIKQEFDDIYMLLDKGKTPAIMIKEKSDVLKKNQRGILNYPDEELMTTNKYNSDIIELLQKFKHLLNKKLVHSSYSLNIRNKIK